MRKDIKKIFLAGTIAAMISGVLPVLAAEPTPARTFATEGFVRSGLATKASAADVASAIASAVGSYVPSSEKGAASGVATLDASGKVPTAQIPSISYNNLSDKPTIPNGSDYLPVVGGTMTGAITLSGAPSANLHAASKAYVDTTVSTAVGNVEQVLNNIRGE